MTVNRAGHVGVSAGLGPNSSPFNIFFPVIYEDDWTHDECFLVPEADITCVGATVVEMEGDWYSPVWAPGVADCNTWTDGVIDACSGRGPIRRRSE